MSWARCSRSRRARPRSPDGEKNMAEAMPRQAARACHCQVSRRGTRPWVDTTGSFAGLLGCWAAGLLDVLGCGKNGKNGKDKPCGSWSFRPWSVIRLCTVSRNSEVRCGRPSWFLPRRSRSSAYLHSALRAPGEHRLKRRGGPRQMTWSPSGLRSRRSEAVRTASSTASVRAADSSMNPGAASADSAPRASDRVRRCCSGAGLSAPGRRRPPAAPGSAASGSAAPGPDPRPGVGAPATCPQRNRRSHRERSRRTGPRMRRPALARTSHCQGRPMDGDGTLVGSRCRARTSPGRQVSKSPGRQVSVRRELGGPGRAGRRAESA